MNLLLKKIDIKASLPYLEKEGQRDFSGRAEDFSLAKEEMERLYPSLGRDLVIGLAKGPQAGQGGRKIFLLKKEDYQGVVGPYLLPGNFIRSVSLPGLTGVNFLSEEVRGHNRAALSGTLLSYLKIVASAFLVLAFVMASVSLVESYLGQKREAVSVAFLRPKYEASLSQYSNQIDEMKKFEICEAASSRVMGVTPILHLISKNLGSAVMVTRMEKKSTALEINGIGTSDSEVLKFRNALQAEARGAGLTCKLKQTDNQGDRRVAFKISLD